MKQLILSELTGKLSAMGIPSQQGNGTDIAIATEFLDAGWSTGNKKISYEASVFANEQDKTIYMFEKTVEVGQGLSFGGGSSTSFQSGTTLFRKVKSIQYGPDGKAYEYSLDLGSIPKAVKETAKQYQWKFKTVLNRSKAMYPAPQSGAPQYSNPQYSNPQYSAPQYSNPQGSFYAAAPKKSGGKAGLFGLIGFILLGIVLLLMLWALETAPVGWLVCLGLFAIAFIIQRMLREKGCLPHLILWVVTALLLLVSVALFSEGDANDTGAKLENGKMTTATDTGGNPEAEPPAVSVNTGETAVNKLPDHHIAYMTVDFGNDTTKVVDVNVANGVETVLLEAPSYMGMLRGDNGKVYGLTENRVVVLENGNIRFITAEDEYVARFDVRDGRIYYGKDNNDASDDVFERLASKDDSGQHETILNEGGISQLVVDDYVYCSISSGPDIATLVRYDLDGSNKIVLYGKPCGSLVKFGAYLYFVDHSDAGSLYRMKNDGSDVKKMVQGPLNFTSSLPNQINGITNIGAIHDEVFYLNTQDGNRLYKANGDSSEKLTEDALSSLYIKDNHIYCTYADLGRAGIYLLDDKGKEFKRVTSTTPNEFVVAE